MKVFSLNLRILDGSLIGKQEGVKEPIDDSDSSPANTATDQTSVSTSNENIDSQNSSSPPQQGVAQSSPITSSTPLPTLPALKDWADLISFRPPHNVQKNITDRALMKGLACDWDIHHIEDASGRDQLRLLSNQSDYIANSGWKTFKC